MFNLKDLKNEKNLYKLGSLITVSSIVILLYHSIHSMINRHPIHLTLPIFIFIKMVGVSIKLPYIWNKYWSRVNILTVLFLYIILFFSYLYGIFIMKL